MKDKEITEIILNEKVAVIAVTIIPKVIYDHMMKKYVLMCERPIKKFQILHMKLTCFPFYSKQ